MPGARPAGMVCKVAPRLHRPPRPSQLVGVCLQRDQVIRAGYRPDRCGERGIDHNACRVDLRTMPAAHAMTLLAHDPAVAARGRAILLPAASSHTCCGRRVAATLLGLALTTSTQPTFSALAAADQSSFRSRRHRPRRTPTAFPSHRPWRRFAIRVIQPFVSPRCEQRPIPVPRRGRPRQLVERRPGRSCRRALPGARLAAAGDIWRRGRWCPRLLSSIRADSCARRGARPSTGHIGVARREAAAPGVKSAQYGRSAARCATPGRVPGPIFGRESRAMR